MSILKPGRHPAADGPEPAARNRQPGTSSLEPVAGDIVSNIFLITYFCSRCFCYSDTVLPQMNDFRRNLLLKADIMLYQQHGRPVIEDQLLNLHP